MDERLVDLITIFRVFYQFRNSFTNSRTVTQRQAVGTIIIDGLLRGASFTVYLETTLGDIFMSSTTYVSNAVTLSIPDVEPVTTQQVFMNNLQVSYNYSLQMESCNRD